MKHRESADESVDVYPLVGFETYLPHGVLCGVTIHYLESPASLVAGEHSSIPLVMRPEMARELATALNKAAEDTESRPEGTH